MNKQFLVIVVLALISLVATSCTCRGESSGPQVSFTADKTSIQPGECITLQWNVKGTDFFGVQLNGQQVSSSGQQKVCPSEATTYTLGVDIGTIILNREVFIAVAGTGQTQPQPSAPGQPPQQPQQPQPSSPGCPGTPVFITFEATPGAITSGQSTTLNWGPVTNGTAGPLVGSVVLTPGNFGEVGSPGSRQVSPTTTTTYTLTATGCGGTATESVTVVVQVIGTPIPIPPQPPLPVPPPTPPGGGGGWSGPPKVTSITAWVDPPTYTGSCPTPAKLSALITVDGPCTVTYTWETSIGGGFPIETIVFSAAGTQQVSRSELVTAPNGQYWSGWLRVKILTPLPMSSNQAPFEITCKP